MKTPIILITLALGLSSAAAFAGEGHEMHAMDHAGMDCMGMSGMSDMTPEKAKAMHDKMFASIDADKNGAISRAEFDSHHADMMAKHKEMMGKQKEEAKSNEGHDHLETHK